MVVSESRKRSVLVRQQRVERYPNNNSWYHKTWQIFNVSSVKRRYWVTLLKFVELIFTSFLEDKHEDEF